MSAKKGDLNLMIPGADGWEIWTGSAVNGFRQHSSTEHLLALDVTGIPSGGVAMAIPVRQVSAVPFRAQTDDLSLLGDLAAMQLEKNGNRPALDGGQLTDHFVYGTAPEETHLTAVVMTPPSEGQLPRKSPDQFDISPRCLPLPEGKVVVWRELGRWVFGIGKPGHALYFQCLSGDRLDARAGNEIYLALTQLQLQGLLKAIPEELVVWSHGSATDARPEELESLSRGLGISVHTSPRPNPTWPVPPSRLLPADVRAERLALQGKRNRNIMIAALAVVYLGVVAYLYFDLKKAKDGAAVVKRQADAVSGEASLLDQHRSKWAELRPVVESDYHPLELFLATYRALPNTKDKRYIRFKKLSFLNQFREIEDELKVAREVVIEGLADQEDQQQIPIYAGNLRSSSDLDAFTWSIQPETIDKRSGKLTFTFVGNATE
jgi:hypothetical protein